MRPDLEKRQTASSGASASDVRRSSRMVGGQGVCRVDPAGSPVRGIAVTLKLGRSPDDAMSMWAILWCAVFGWIAFSFAMVAVIARLGGSVHADVTTETSKVRRALVGTDEAWLGVRHHDRAGARRTTIRGIARPL
jgi:hypothetical protein